jgi:hypothetical protein
MQASFLFWLDSSPRLMLDSSSRYKINNMLCYFHAFVLLQEVSSIIDHYLGLSFGSGNERQAWLFPFTESFSRCAPSLESGDE